MSDTPPPGGYPPQDPQQPQYQPPQQPYQQPQQPAYQPPPAAPQPPPQPQYQPPPQPQYQPPPQPQYQQPAQFQPVNPPAKSGNGCLKVFLIVLLISVVLGVIGTVGIFFLGKNAIDDNLGEAKASDYTASITDCSVDQTLGWPTAKGSLVNNSDKTRSYRMQVDFTATDGTKVDSVDYVTTASLSKGEKGTWTATGTKSSNGQDVKCEVKKVYYFGT